MEVVNSSHPTSWPDVVMIGSAMKVLVIIPLSLIMVNDQLLIILDINNRAKYLPNNIT